MKKVRIQAKRRRPPLANSLSAKEGGGQAGSNGADAFTRNSEFLQ